MSALLQVDAQHMPGGYGLALLQAVLALAAVCLLAWVFLRWAAKFGWGKAGDGGRIKVIERRALDARRSLYLVDVDGKVFVIGVGDGAAPTLITSLGAAPAEQKAGVDTHAIASDPGHRDDEVA